MIKTMPPAFWLLAMALSACSYGSDGEDHSTTAQGMLGADCFESPEGWAACGPVPVGDDKPKFRCEFRKDETQTWLECVDLPGGEEVGRSE